MSYLSRKQKVSLSYNHATKEFSTCISEGSTYIYNNTEKATTTKSSKVTFKRYMDTTTDENSYINDKENMPIIEIPVTDELPVIDAKKESLQERKAKVRFAARISNASIFEPKEPSPDRDIRPKTILKQRKENVPEKNTVEERINEREKRLEANGELSPPRKTPSPKETPKLKPRSSSLRPARINFNEVSSRRYECKHINVLFDGKCLGCGISVTEEEKVPKRNARRKLSSESLIIASSSTGNTKENIAEKPLINVDTSSNSSDDGGSLNRTFIISPKPPTPPRIPRQYSGRMSRHGSITRKSPLRSCKHRILEDDGKCVRCKTFINSKMFSSMMASPIDPEKAFTARTVAAENKPSPAINSAAKESLPWPLPSRKELAPFTYVNPSKGRFIVQKDTEIIYEAVKKDDNKMNACHVKYIFRVSKEGSKQIVTVCTPRSNQLVPHESSPPLLLSKTLNKFTNLQELESQYPGYYKHVCKALKIISGRVPRIECRNTLEIKYLYARIMINGDFRLIFPNNKVLYHKFGTPDDKIEIPKNTEFSTLTADERNIFNKAREFIRDLDKVHRKTNGPNYHGIIVQANLKSENDSVIVGRVKSPAFQSPAKEQK